MPEDFSDSSELRFPRVALEAGKIVFIPLVLSICGLIAQTSAGQSYSPSSPLGTFYKQALFIVPALVACFVAAKINLDRLRSYWVLILAGALLLLVSIYVPGLGKVVKGSRRWIELGGLSLQVSDPAKIALVFVLSHYLAEARRFFRPAKFRLFERIRAFEKFPRLGKLRIKPSRDLCADFVRGFLIPCVIIGIVCAPIWAEPDLGTTLLCAAVGMIMLFLAGGRLAYILSGASAGFAYVAITVLFWPNRLQRVVSFWETEANKGDAGYQLWQALTGFAEGGVSGKGLGNGMSYSGFLPEAHTDFIYAVIGEDFGFIGATMIPILVLLFFAIVISQLQKIADVFYFNICLGSLLFIVLQATINIFVILGLLPTKGMSFPFISYGGSNLVVMFTFVGLICNSALNWRKAYIPRPTEF